MGFTKLSALLFLLYVNAFCASDVPVKNEEEVEAPATSPALDVTVRATFPQAEVFGVKLINGRPTRSVLSVSNNEAAPVKVSLVGGSLWAPPVPAAGTSAGGEWRLIQNLTAVRYNVEIPAGAKESLTYAFTTDLQPADLRLNLGAVVADSKGKFYTLQAYNETVSVVEPETSLLDPQIIFLYLFLLAAFAGASYYIYNTYIDALLPQRRRRGKGGEWARTSSRGSKKVDPAEQVAVVGADGPAVTSAAKAYDESWIPEHHINRPEARRIKSGAGGGSSAGSSAGNVSAGNVSGSGSAGGGGAVRSRARPKAD